VFKVLLSKFGGSLATLIVGQGDVKLALSNHLEIGIK
jgi:hypothetical protein